MFRNLPVHRKYRKYEKYWDSTTLPPLIDVSNVHITKNYSIVLIRCKRSKRKAEPLFRKYQIYLKSIFKPNQVFFAGKQKQIIAICDEYLVIYGKRISRKQKGKAGEFVKRATSLASDFMDINR